MLQHLPYSNLVLDGLDWCNVREQIVLSIWSELLPFNNETREVVVSGVLAIAIKGKSHSCVYEQKMGVKCPTKYMASLGCYCVSLAFP